MLVLILQIEVDRQGLLAVMVGDCVLQEVDAKR
jgi:hypothetical protein